MILVCSVLTVISFVPMGPPALLKRILLVTAILRFYRIETETGAFTALTMEEFKQLVYYLGVIAALELSMYDKAMMRKMHRRKIAEHAWRDEAKSNVRHGLD